MSNKEMALNLFNKIPESKIGYLLAYMQGLLADEDDEETPNDVTIAAIEASENDEDMYGPFDSISDLMEALNA